MSRPKYEKADLLNYKGTIYKSPLQAIRNYCLDCCNNSKDEIKFCQSFKCPLYLYRFNCNGVKVLNK